jgi:hypothetical protein
VALTGVSALGVASGALATATGVGAPPGLPLTGVSLAGVATGAAMIGLAGEQLTTAAQGADRVTPLGSNPFGDTFPAGAATAPTMIDAAGNEWDRNGTWEALPNAIPKGEDIEHTPTSQTHIPYGQYYPNGQVGGGHIFGSGVPDKTVFPEDWEAEQILDQVLDVARNPDQAPTINPRTGNWEIVGKRAEVEIQVVLDPEGKIITARPIRGPGVRVNDAHGDPQPQGD